MSQIFISYSHQDKVYAHKVHRYLCDRGFDAWIDDRIDYGSHWPVEIETRLRECAAFVLIMSPNSYKSEWVQNELSFARQLSKPILPLLLDGTVWWHLQTTQYVDVTGGKRPPEKFYVLLAKFAPRDREADAEPQPPLQKLKELQSQAIEFEVSGKLPEALQIYYQIRNIDPSFPQIDAKIKKLEQDIHEKAKRVAEEANRKTLEDQATRNAQINLTLSKYTTAIKSVIRSTVQKAPDIAAKPLVRIVIVLAVLASLVIVTTRYTARKSPFLFSGNLDGKVNVYFYSDGMLTQLTQVSNSEKNWSPAVELAGDIYFTSNRDGKAEIYRLTDGKTERVTNTPGPYKSWSPAVGLSRDIYFTSNRDGRAEIYRLMDGKTERFTNTPGQYESWSPAVGINGDIYFTSNRDGKAEIYRLNNGKIERVTNTPGRYESWSPAVTIGADIYFTSNRDGKAEIYRLIDGKTERVTTTPGSYESWAPIAQGQNVYFTSNRSGRNQIYTLSPQITTISDLTSWTKLLTDKLPDY